MFGAFTEPQVLAVPQLTTPTCTRFPASFTWTNGPPESKNELNMLYRIVVVTLESIIRNWSFYLQSMQTQIHLEVLCIPHGVRVYQAKQRLQSLDKLHDLKSVW